jgi:23S rRNA pseudouridine2605 synthase
VDGRPAVLGERVDPELQRIEVSGRPLRVQEPSLVHLAIHKPAGVTSTVRDRHAARTIIDLVPAELARGARLYPVGRLDQDSEGLILVTNDGDWAERVLHPRYGVEREYAVGLAHPLTREQAQALESGVELSEGVATVTGLRGQTNTEDRRLADMLDPRPDRQVTWVRVTIHQGWKRQLRRMFAEVGAPVRRLVRVRIGTIRLEGLATGDVRPLTPAEVRRLGAGTSSAAREGR